MQFLLNPPEGMMLDWLRPTIYIYDEAAAYMYMLPNGNRHLVIKESSQVDDVLGSVKYVGKLYTWSLRGQFPTFATREEAMQAKLGPKPDPHPEAEEGDVVDPFDCMDNVRFAYDDDMGQMDEYEKTVESGCCGSYDVRVVINSRLAHIGCNYGH